MTRSEVLDKAKEIINKDRNSQYGEPEDNFAHTAAYWNTYLVDHGLTKAINGADVGVMMTLFKVSRMRTSPNLPDHYVDGAGYLACGAEIALSGGSS